MLRRVLLLLPLVALAGCSRSGPPLPTAVPVKGRVLLPDGQPLRQARVMFNPTGIPAIEAFADLDANGAFSLQTYRPDDGAVPGEYKVTISPYDYKSRTGSPTPTPGAGRIPRRYLDAGSTDVTVKVEPAGNTGLEIRLKN